MPWEECSQATDSGIQMAKDGPGGAAQEEARFRAGPHRTQNGDFAGGCLVDTEPTQALPAHVVIHCNLMNRVALPTMHCSSV